ncbi:hypothetical protein FOCC_FOCC012030, partial [Frankliniella occidentalis]
MCSIGDFDGTSCSSSRLTDKTVVNFSEAEWNLICARSGVINTVETVCLNHERRLLNFYETNHPHCEDPDSTHTESKRKSQKRVTYDTYLKLQYDYPNLHPGKGLCLPCYVKLAVKFKRGIYRQILESSTATVSSGKETTVSLNTTVQSDTSSDKPLLKSNSDPPEDPLFHLSPPSLSREARDAIADLNLFLRSHGLSIDPLQVLNVSYAQTKLNETCSVMRNIFESAIGRSLWQASDDLNEFLTRLKEKYKQCTKSSERVRILSLLPSSWTQRRIMEEFGLTAHHLITVTNRLVAEQGILPSMKPRIGQSLGEDVLKKVQDFYEDDEENVYILPGKGNSYSVKIGGEKVHMQKRMLLNTVSELHSLFLTKHPDVTISFSKFASLRPKYCVLPNGPGTHTVCVCSTHQNVRLMVEGAGLFRSTKEDMHPIETEHDCLKMVQCDPPTHECLYKECNDCPGLDALKEILEVTFDIESIDQVTFDRWVKGEKHWTLETLIKPSEEFIACLLEDVDNLRLHDFLACQQRNYLAWRKSQLADDEALVIMDFSENYSFSIQKSIQAFHWSNDQSTVHPFVAYYRNMESKAIEVISYVTISEHLKHSVYAVHSFQKKFLKFLKEKIPGLKRIVYFTDGCAAQYKSLNTTANLCHHLSDFGLNAEHHYFATSHGKTANDGVGGTLKRTARLASLKGSIIKTPQQLYSWAIVKWDPNDPEVLMHFDFVSNEEIEEETEKLNARFKHALPVPNIMQVHSIIPQSKFEVITRYYSRCPEAKRIVVRKTRDIPKWDTIAENKFVTVPHSGS